MTIDDNCVPGLVAEQARRHPDRIAVEWEAGRLTYAELMSRAARLAHPLRAAGAGPAGPVGILMPRSPEMIVALLAVTQTGAAYVPVDPTDAPARQRTILSDAGVTVLITGETDGLGVDLPDVRVVGLAELTERSAGAPEQPPAVDIAGTDLAYVTYTSGSTGRPKGVQVEHRNVVNLVRGTFVDHSVPQTMCTLAPLAFDASTFEIWAALCNGHRLVVPTAGLVDPDQIGAVAQRHGVTLLHLTKGLFNVVVEAGAPGLGGVRHLLTGGDKLSPSHVRRAIELLPRTRVGQCYGPTEATTFTTAYPEVPVSDIGESVPLGSPIDGAWVHVLDDQQRPVPIGEEGELYIGGAGVVRGYTDPGLTAERFLPDPFAPVPGEHRMYRTGDRVRRRPDGALLFLGRTDTQVKIRGHRVEPGEVEHVLAELTGVRDVCCLAREGADGEFQLVAYVVGDGVDADDVRRHVESRLAPYLRPSTVELLDALPLNRNGKVDRAALLDRTSTATGRRTDPAPADAAPTPTEAYLSDLWRELLGRAPEHLDEDFFAAGGHSLTAMRITSRIRHDLGRRVSVAKFFAHPTPRTLAALVDSLPKRAGRSVTRRRDRRTAPMSPFQHGLWVLHQLAPTSPAYHVPMAFEIAGAVDPAALERALALVAARHEALRTSIAVEAGSPVQRIVERLDVRLERAGLPMAAQGGDEALRQQLVKFVGRPFDLAEGPLWRAVLHSDGERRHVLLIVMHHLITDGWSMEVLKRDLSTAYAAVSAGTRPDWPELAVQFADVAGWEDSAEARDQIREEQDYWRGKLAGAVPPLRLPARPDRPADVTFAVDRVSARLGDDTTAGLRSLAREHGTSLFSVLLAGFALMLSRAGGQDRLHIGSPLAVRDETASKDVVGFFNNTVVLRCVVDEERSFSDLLAEIHETVVGALAHRHVPFESLVADLAPARVPGRNPLFDVWFNMLSYDSHPLTLGEARVSPMPPPVAAALFDLSAYVDDGPEGIELQFVYNPDVFLADRVAAMLAQTSALLEEVCRDPGRLVADLSPATARPGTLPAPAPTPGTGLWDRLDAHPAERPAVERDGRSVSYGELRTLARRTGERLAAQGVGAGDVVALATDRTPELLLGMLGAWWSGAAITVVDPAHPTRRVVESLRTLSPRALLHATGDTAPEPAASALRELDIRVAGPVADPGATGRTGGARRIDPRAAYVLQTSGSTGRPLHVVGTDGPLRVFFQWYANTFRLGPQDRFSVLAGLTHDPLLRETLLPLWLGATSCLPPPLDPGDQLSWIVREGVTVVHLTPAMLRLLAAASDGSRAPAVRLLALGGAAVTAADHRAAVALFPEARRISLYGATETPQGVSVTDLDVEFAPGRPMFPPLGGGSPSAEVGVLRRGRVHRAGVNEVGEVYVRGPHLALGYLDEAELATERFLDDPWGDGPSSRLYRTGDLGRVRPDGTVEFLGRVDDQLSVSGYRVEPAEIERVLAEHPGVVDAAVTVVRGRLAAAVRLTDPAPRTGDLTRHLAQRLPAALLVAEIVVVERLPLTTHGKVDRSALAEELGRRTSSPVESATRAELLGTLTEVWRGVLGLESVDPDRTFFDQGGTSLALLRAHELICAKLGRELELVDLFRYPTPRGLATALAAPVEALAPPPARAGADREPDGATSEVDRIRLARQKARARAHRAPQS